MLGKDVIANKQFIGKHLLTYDVQVRLYMSQLSDTMKARELK